MSTEKNKLVERGILYPDGQINKPQINLVSGAITKPFAEMIWCATGNDKETINRFTDILVEMNNDADRKKLFKIVQRLIIPLFSKTKTETKSAEQPIKTAL